MTGAGPGRPFARWSAVRARVVALAGAPPPLLVVTDFDGTLSPISSDPLGARILPLGRAALRRLARLADARPDRLHLAVLSGRTASDVAGRVRVGGLDYLGNHGLEGGRLARGRRAERLDVRSDPALERHVVPARTLGEAVAGLLGRPDWLFVEQKGPSVAFHFRAAREPEAARVAVIEAIAAAERTLGGHGLARLDGRKVIEFRPAEAGGKGAAMARLLRRDGARSALMLGDDRSDAEAFRVLAEARRSGALQTTLSIGVHGATETPVELVEQADLLVTAPHDAARALSALASALEAEAARATAAAPAVRPAPE